MVRESNIFIHLGGGAGSGKTRLKDAILEQQLFRGAKTIDPDSYLVNFEGYDPKKIDPMIQKQSKQIAENILDQHIENSEPVIIYDGTMKSDNVLSRLRKSKAKGYVTIVFGISCDIYSAHRINQNRERTVPLTAFVETHLGFIQTIEKVFIDESVDYFFLGHFESPENLSIFDSQVFSNEDMRSSELYFAPLLRSCWSQVKKKRFDSLTKFCEEHEIKISEISDLLPRKH